MEDSFVITEVSGSSGRGSNPLGRTKIKTKTYKPDFFGLFYLFDIYMTLSATHKHQKKLYLKIVWETNRKLSNLAFYFE